MLRTQDGDGVPLRVHAAGVQNRSRAKEPIGAPEDGQKEDGQCINTRGC